MKRIGILNAHFQVIDQCKVSSTRYQRLIEIVEGDFKLQENGKKKIFLSLTKLQNKIDELLSNTEERELSIPEYGKRFREEDIFEIRFYNGRKYKICNSGYDNQILFLLNILDVVCNDIYMCLII